MTDKPTRSRKQVLIVDDSVGHAEATAEALERDGFRCIVAKGAPEALEVLDGESIDMLITDLVMNPVSGLELLRRIRSDNRDLPVVLLTGYPTSESALDSVKEAGVSYLRKPFDIKDLRENVRQVLDEHEQEDVAVPAKVDDDQETSLQRHVEHLDLDGIVGASEAMKNVYETIRRVADTDVTVLVRGESGTGKELIARALHRNSRRSKNRFVPINCAALNEGTLESELFGHSKGAFTGAHRDRKGRFEFADEGTLFLDEIGDMPLQTQTKFLRVLEFREVTRLGENEPVDVDVRIIAATHRDLEERVDEGAFRQDLLHRLRVIEIYLPPLRERPEDLNLLIDHFIKRANKRHGRNVRDLSPEAHKTLASYTWPGNVRELKNCIESMVVKTTGQTLDEESVPPHILGEDERRGEQFQLTGMSIDEAERHLIINTLKMVDGNRQEAADILGISPRTLARRIKKYDLDI